MDGFNNTLFLIEAECANLTRHNSVTFNPSPKQKNARQAGVFFGVGCVFNSGHAPGCAEP